MSAKPPTPAIVPRLLKGIGTLRVLAAETGDEVLVDLVNQIDKIESDNQGLWDRLERLERRLDEQRNG